MGANRGDGDIKIDRGSTLGNEQNIDNYGYIGTWILRKYRKISVNILTKISVMQKLTKYFEIHGNTLLNYKKGINKKIYTC